jgi:hypothetical protein
MSEKIFSSFENKQETVSNVLDAELYERFREACFEDYEYLEGDKAVREQQKRSFFDNEVVNPKLDYPHLETFDFDGRESALLQLKEDALNHGDPVVSQAYRWRINEQIAQLRMLRASQVGNDRRFGRYSRYIYGAPVQEIFEYDLKKVKKIVEDARVSGDEERVQAAEWLCEHLTFGNEQNVRTETFPKKEKDTTENLGVDEVIALFEKSITELNLSGWKVVVDGNRKTVSASQEHKTVFLPQDISRTKRKIEALIAHELGTHALRRERGERSKLRLLGLGLDRYTKGEEGVATYEQHKVEGADEYAGFLGHFGGSLAHGLDGTKRDFREVFEVLKHYNIARLKSVSGEDRIKEAQEQSWGTCVRTFRGTTCASAGTAFTKDIIYREGNIGVYDVVNTNEREAHRFMVGKYDPTNERHIWILDQLGITEEDIETLENGE